MTKMMRIRNIIVSLIMIFISLVLFIDGDEGFTVVSVFLCLSLFATAIKELYYYFSMARYMVGGRRVFYKGVVLLSFAFSAITFDDLPKIAVLVYLVALLFIGNLFDVLGALDLKKVGSNKWISKFCVGMLGIILSIVCLLYYKKPEIVTYMYAVGLFYTSVAKIINSCRKTSIIYIQ